MILAVIAAVVLIAGPKNLLSYKYKMPYQEYVTKYAKQYEIDQYLVYAVMKSESSFIETAVSHKEAMGLMQLTEETGLWAAGKMGLSIQSKEELFEPENNIKIGTWYLRHLLDTFDNNLTNALAAYNAGPGNVNNWLSNTKYSKDGKTLDKIPFSDTRHYVDKVYRYYNRYKELNGVK